MDRIFETNSNFHVKQGTMGKVQFLSYKSFFLVLTKFLLGEEDWALGYNSVMFCNFPDISFPKILSLKLFGNSWGNSHIPCLLLVIMLCFTCGERRIWSTIKKSQNYDHDCLQNFCLLFISLLTVWIVKNSHMLAEFTFSF